MTIDQPPFIASREQVVREARALLGSPYHDQGRLPGVGIDCFGVYIVPCWNLNIWPRTFDERGYSRQPGNALKVHCDKYLIRIPRAAMQPGDVVIVARNEMLAHHMGVIGDHRYGCLSLIHATEIFGKVVETRLVFANSMRFIAAYALPGVG